MTGYGFAAVFACAMAAICICVSLMVTLLLTRGRVTVFNRDSYGRLTDMIER